MKARRKLLTAMILSLLWVMAPASSAEDFYPKDGFYIGGYFTQDMMSGDFDDSKVYGSPLTGEIIGVPDIDDGTGWGVVFGIRSKKSAVEFGYTQSGHDTSSILFGESEAIFREFDINLKFDVFAKNRLRPYLLLGCGFPWLTIQDNDYDVYDESLSDATYFGFGLNAGCGLAYYLNPRLAITGGLISRWCWFTSAEGLELDKNLLENVVGFNIGVAWTF